MEKARDACDTSSGYPRSRARVTPISSASVTCVTEGNERTRSASREPVMKCREPVMKWQHHPNLSLRPHAPNAGRGRLQRQIRRAFVAGGPVLSSSEIYDWTYVGRARLRRSHLHRLRIWKLLQEVAEPVGRAPTTGRPWLWRLRNGHALRASPLKPQEKRRNDRPVGHERRRSAPAAFPESWRAIG
jgi:hypothetical protein